MNSILNQMNSIHILTIYQICFNICPTNALLFQMSTFQTFQLNFDIFLTVHLNIFILILTNLMH